MREEKASFREAKARSQDQVLASTKEVMSGWTRGLHEYLHKGADTQSPGLHFNRVDDWVSQD